MFYFLNPLLGRHPERVNANVEIYTWQTCPYCIRAKMLLWWKGVKFTEFDTPQPKGVRILGSTSPLNLDSLRYLSQRWFSPQALTFGLPDHSCTTAIFV
jgi:hypothetical protein